MPLFTRLMPYTIVHLSTNLHSSAAQKNTQSKKTLIPFQKKKYINFGATLILRPLPCTELNSIQGDGHGLGVAANSLTNVPVLSFFNGSFLFRLFINTRRCPSIIIVIASSQN